MVGMVCENEMDGRKKSSRSRGKGRGRRWVSSVKTASTYPPKAFFTKSASRIASTLASKRVSPKGPGSGMRMLTYFVNRAGRGLSARRRAELERAKTLLSKRIREVGTSRRKSVR